MTKDHFLLSSGLTKRKNEILFKHFYVKLLKSKVMKTNKVIRAIDCSTNVIKYLTWAIDATNPEEEDKWVKEAKIWVKHIDSWLNEN